MIQASLVKHVPTQFIARRKNKKKFLAAILNQLLALPLLIVGKNFQQFRLPLDKFFRISKVWLPLDTMQEFWNNKFAPRHFLSLLLK